MTELLGKGLLGKSKGALIPCEMVGDDEMRIEVNSPILCSGRSVVEITTIVLKSKNGGVGKMSLQKLKTTKQIVLDLLMEEQLKTRAGLDKFLSAGDVLILPDIFWIKSKTETALLKVPKSRDIAEALFGGIDGVTEVIKNHFSTKVK